MSEVANPVKLQVRDFIVNYANTRGTVTVADDEHLFKTNIVDSLGVFRLIAFLEDSFPFTMEDSDIVPENFETIDRITAFVSEKIGHPAEQPARCSTMGAA